MEKEAEKLKREGWVVKGESTGRCNYGVKNKGETSRFVKTKMEEQIRSILRSIGEDPDREGLLKTPSRVVESLIFLTRGYDSDPEKVINEALFTENYEEMIVQKDIDFFSLCEHHLLPFFGKAHVAYIPHHKIVGISKLARLVDVYARRLQVQERLTSQIASTIMEKLQPLGAAVVIEAEHLCMRMRGVEKQNSLVITSTLLGVFRTRQDTRAEFMNLIRQRS
ncbi:MAG: GTP cyclohydrolase I FolE [Deltaproteobacteria bacterium]|nr:GTP cyclohydrolase I FolE [Deltaproteobacteria bacterium]